MAHGVKRRASSFNSERVDHLYVDPHEAKARFFLHYGDMTDATNLTRPVQEMRPDEISNLAAQGKEAHGFGEHLPLVSRSSWPAVRRRDVSDGHPAFARNDPKT